MVASLTRIKHSLLVALDSMNPVRIIQMMIFVGRNRHARAASSRHFRRLQRALDDDSIVQDPIWPTHLPDSLRSSGSSSVIRSFSSSSSSLFFFSLGVIVHLHGQKYNATTVKVVSRQLDKVLVEQNHCHGLTTVSIRYTLSV